MPDDATPKVSQGMRLPPQTVERWRQIVQRAVANGTDISQLVQHFAERAFENKTVSLDTQGAKRRALTQMRQTLSREIRRAEKALQAHQESGRATLLRPYEGITLTFLPPQRGQKAKKVNASHVVPLALDADTQASKASPLQEKLRTSQELVAYIANLAAQGEAMDQDMAQIDEVLNQGMANRDSTVKELSATTQELWRLAQIEVEADRAKKWALSQETGAPSTAPLPTPLSDEKTQGNQQAPQPAATADMEDVTPPPAPAEKGLKQALATGKSLLHNMQSLFKKKS